MVARGILHGCIGECCSKEYPSVFANLGDKSIWNFIVGKSFAQTLVIDDNIVGDDSQTLLIVLILVILILILAFIILFIWFKRKKDKKSNIVAENDSEVGEKLLDDTNQPQIVIANTEKENDFEQSNDESDVEEDDTFKEVSLIRFPQKERQIPWNEGFASNNRAKMEALCPNANM